MIKKQSGFTIAEGLVFVITIVIVGFVGWYVWHSKNTANTLVSSNTLPLNEKSEQLIPSFDHIVVIVEENKGYKTIMEASDTPYIHKLAASYAQATNYLALFHPSLPNYLAMTGGTNGGIENNCAPGPGCELNSTNIIDEMEGSNRSWKGYMESMPSACGLQDAGRYAVRHNPFVYYRKLTDNTKRCERHVVPFDQLNKDLELNQLPNFSFITPDLCNDMHDCPAGTGDKWLAETVPKLLESSAFKSGKSLLVLTWDEAEKSSSENQIPTILVGSVVKRAYESSKTYTHYSLLRTIEEAWGLSSLTESDKTAPPLSEFFVESN